MTFLRGRKTMVGLGLAAVALALAPHTAMAEHRAFNYAVIGRDFAFGGIPRVLPAATYDTRFYNVGKAPHVLVGINLGEECADLTRAELIEVFDLGEEGFFEVCTDATVLDANQEGVFAPPGGNASGVFTLTPGRTVFACFVGRHYALGMMSFTNVIDVG